MRLLDQVRHKCRLKHFSYRTEQAYVHWAEKYIRFHGIRHPNKAVGSRQSAVAVGSGRVLWLVFISRIGGSHAGRIQRFDRVPVGISTGNESLPCNKTISLRRALFVDRPDSLI